MKGGGGYKNTWMLWIALALVACLPPLDVPPLVALSLSCAVVGWWTLMNVSLRTLFVTLMFSILDVFFREIGARNQFKVPHEGAPVFLVAPHANQFLDPFVVMYGTLRSDVAFLAAAKSMRKRIVGGRAAAQVDPRRARAGPGVQGARRGVARQRTASRCWAAARASRAAARGRYVRGGVTGRVESVESDGGAPSRAAEAAHRHTRHTR